MVNRIYSPGLQLNKANAAEAPVLDLHLSISNVIVSIQNLTSAMIDFYIVNFPFFDDDITRSASYRVSMVFIFLNLHNASIFLKEVKVNQGNPCLNLLEGLSKSWTIFI